MAKASGEVLEYLRRLGERPFRGLKGELMATKKHPGFAGVQKKIEGEGYSKKSAGAILANATRKASPAAKAKNPKLKKVKK